MVLFPPWFTVKRCSKHRMKVRNERKANVTVASLLDGPSSFSIFTSCKRMISPDEIGSQGEDILETHVKWWRSAGLGFQLPYIFMIFLSVWPYYRPQMKWSLGQGYIFTSVCDSFCSHGVCVVKVSVLWWKGYVSRWCVWGCVSRRW